MRDEHTPQVGDVYRTSWGYDQTNVEFFQVVAKTATGKSVKLRATAAEVRDETGYGRVYPKIGEWARDYGLDGNASHEWTDRETGETFTYTNETWDAAEANGYSETGWRRVTGGAIKVDTKGYIRNAYWYDLAEDAGAFDTLAAGYPGH